MRYKEYKLGDVFSVESVNKLSIPGKNYVMDRDIIDKDGTVPYIAAISTNNGITGYSSKYEANNKGDCILCRLRQTVLTLFFIKKTILLDVSKLLVSEEKINNIWDIMLDYILFQLSKRLQAVSTIQIS